MAPPPSLHSQRQGRSRFIPDGKRNRNQSPSLTHQPKCVTVPVVEPVIVVTDPFVFDPFTGDWSEGDTSSFDPSGLDTGDCGCDFNVC